MKSRVKYDAVATVGRYKDRNTGEEKKHFLKVGTVFESEDGRISLKLDAVPCSPEWSGFISFYEPKRQGHGDWHPSERNGMVTSDGEPKGACHKECRPLQRRAAKTRMKFHSEK